MIRKDSCKQKKEKEKKKKTYLASSEEFSTLFQGPQVIWPSFNLDTEYSYP